MYACRNPQVYHVQQAQINNPTYAFLHRGSSGMRAASTSSIMMSKSYAKHRLHNELNTIMTTARVGQQCGNASTATTNGAVASTSMHPPYNLSLYAGGPDLHHLPGQPPWARHLQQPVMLNPCDLCYTHLALVPHPLTPTHISSWHHLTIMCNKLPIQT
jgi:hypothetical protein